MKYWVHWLFVLATLTCALQLTFAGVEDVEDVEDGGVCEWDDDTDMVSILPFEDDDACELDDDTNMGFYSQFGCFGSIAYGSN
ncbi:hypothetical protein H4S03_003930 [Coemansia sp. S3946]|nr:hypothetical protein H4S03_003930 [Coemansia sp. S3946]